MKVETGRKSKNTLSWWDENNTSITLDVAGCSVNATGHFLHAVLHNDSVVRNNSRKLMTGETRVELRIDLSRWFHVHSGTGICLDTWAKSSAPQCTNNFVNLNVTFPHIIATKSAEDKNASYRKRIHASAGTIDIFLGGGGYWKKNNFECLKCLSYPVATMSRLSFRQKSRYFTIIASMFPFVIQLK